MRKPPFPREQSVSPLAPLPCLGKQERAMCTGVHGSQEGHEEGGAPSSGVWQTADTPAPRLLHRLAGWAGGNTEESGVSLSSTDWVKTCAWTLGHSQEPWAPVIVLVFGDITTGRRARPGTARALEPNCLDSDAGPATLRRCDLGKAAQHFGASVSCPQNGNVTPTPPRPRVLSCREARGKRLTHRERSQPACPLSRLQFVRPKDKKADQTGCELASSPGR